MVVMLNADSERTARGIEQWTDGPLKPYSHGLMSKKFTYWANEKHLLVVAPLLAARRTADQALAYGLSYVGDRSLALALPEDTATATLRRLPWIGSTVNVYEVGQSDPSDVRPLDRPTRDDVLAITGAFGRPDHDLGASGSDAAALVAWANDHPHLTPSDRTSARVWKCRGRKVLELRRTGSSVRVVAGVKGTDKGKGFRSVTHVVGETSSPRTIAAIQAVVEHAVDQRVAGIDMGHPEHALQAYLARHPQLLGLKPKPKPEFPAHRADGGLGFIDLLGVDNEGAVHLVETKIGTDVMLVLQGVDYWIWAEAHAEQLGLVFKVSEPLELQLDFIVVLGKTELSSHTSAQLNALASNVRARLFSLPRVPQPDEWDAALHPKLLWPSPSV
jgi:hypothetical protein